MYTFRDGGIPRSEQGFSELQSSPLLRVRADLATVQVNQVPAPITLFPLLETMRLCIPVTRKLDSLLGCAKGPVAVHSLKAMLDADSLALGSPTWSFGGHGRERPGSGVACEREKTQCSLDGRR